MNNVVCYSAITGGYDKISDPFVVSDKIDYICFTDNIDRQKSNIWKFLPIPKELDGLSNVKKQRILKICPHKWFKEYDYSIWIDGNMQIKDDLMKLFNQYDITKNFFYVRKHPDRTCIYTESIECVKAKKDILKNIEPQMLRYKNEGFPQNFGLVESGILLRRHNEPKCILLDNTWAIELLNGSHRDQLSFNYACWKTGLTYGTMDKHTNIKHNQNSMFQWRVKHG